jgi:hypothetical protein
MIVFFYLCQVVSARARGRIRPAFFAGAQRGDGLFPLGNSK